MTQRVKRSERRRRQAEREQKQLRRDHALYLEASGQETKMIDDKVIEACSRAAHEVNRAYCLALGDTSQPPWDEAPQWQKSSARNGVAGALAGNTPEQSHELWLAEKKAAGWKYGPVKDPEKKEHPCFVPYDELSANQRHKDLLFVGVVRTMAAVLGATVVYPAMPATSGMPAFPERTIDWSNVEPR